MIKGTPVLLPSQPVGIQWPGCPQLEERPLHEKGRWHDPKCQVLRSRNRLQPKQPTMAPRTEEPFGPSQSIYGGHGKLLCPPELNKLRLVHKGLLASKYSLFLHRWHLEKVATKDTLEVLGWENEFRLCIITRPERERDD